MKENRKSQPADRTRDMALRLTSIVSHLNEIEEDLNLLLCSFVLHDGKAASTFIDCIRSKIRRGLDDANEVLHPYLIEKEKIDGKKPYYSLLKRATR